MHGFVRFNLRMQQKNLVTKEKNPRSRYLHAARKKIFVLQIFLLLLAFISICYLVETKLWPGMAKELKTVSYCNIYLTK